MEKPFQW